MNEPQKCLRCCSDNSPFGYGSPLLPIREPVWLCKNCRNLLESKSKGDDEILRKIMMNKINDVNKLIR